MTQLLRLTNDLRAALAVCRELGDITPAVEAPLRMWFSDVPFPDLPIKVMEFEADERTALMTTVLSEMVDACKEAPTDDDEAAFEQLGPVLDSLWRELVGLRAETINEEVAVVQQNILHIQDRFEGPAEELAERMLDMTIGDALEESIQNAHVRLVLKTLGIVADET
jgi:hypothetical protein